MTIQCPLCGSSELLPFRHGANLLQCLACRVLFCYPMPDALSLAAIYAANYYDSWGGDEQSALVTKQKKSTFLPHLERIRGLQPQGRILDVGCARGDFLELAREQGYDPYGVEFSPYAAAWAAKRLGAERVQAGTLATARLEPQSFAVITLFDCIEHMTDPGAELAIMARLLAPGGVLYLVTPDAASWSQWLMGSQWWHYKAEHLFYFDRRNLADLVRRHGFAPLEVGGNRKTLSLDYLIHQLRCYPVFLLTPMAKLLSKVLPATLRQRFVTFPSGEFYLVARKV